MNHLKILASAIIFFSASVQADQSCWSAGVLDGVCYQQTSRTQSRVNFDVSEKIKASTPCWSAGILDGMCFDSSHNPAKSTVKQAIPETQHCWTAGALNGMCF